jgi:predicted acyltransferase
MNHKSPPRLLSLDALRGFDMFWIIGGEELFRALGEIINRPWSHWYVEQLEHVPWDGFHAYDLIFPLFMFISGVAIPYAITGKREQGVPRATIVRKVIKRALLLVLLGFVYNSILDFHLATQRYPSVLGQIGLAYLIAALVVVYTRRIWVRVFWILGILAGIALIQLLVPVPGVGAGVLTPEGCINGYIDRLLLPGTLYGKVFDPEGILCIISASSVVLMGSLAGFLIRSGRFSAYRNTLILAGSGAILILLTRLLSPWYPVIKAAWTSTFDILTAGISLGLLALFYLLVDVWKGERWSFFLRVIGMNSITIYLAVRMINFRATSDFLVSGFARFFGEFSPVILYLGLLTLEWMFLYFLYKKKIFLRV